MFFRDVIGHQRQVEELRLGLTGGRLPHALLFCGKRGVGKRLVADALVAASLCESGVDEACGVCPSCKAFAHGNHSDFELVKREPGKRDVGIPQIRQLLETLHRKGTRPGGRAVIVDDAERLTGEAQNAFLKTLEEPPPGTLLVLVTAVAERLLPTVRSRCAIHRFGPLTDREMAAFAARSGAGSGPLALAAGAPGRLERLTDEGLLAGRDAALRFLVDLRSISPFDLAARLVECATSTAGEAEDEDRRESTRDRLQLLLRLLSFALRDLMVLGVGGEDVPLFNPDWRDRLEVLAGAFDADRVDQALDLCEQAIVDLRRNMDPALALEDAATSIRSALS